VKLTTMVALGTMLVAAAVGSPAFAQETQPPQARDPRAEILLRQLVDPVRPVPAESLTRDDIQHLPPPRPDRLSDTVRFSVTVNDPRCLPGEDLLPEPGPAARWDRFPEAGPATRRPGRR
jgi:hypothetical protein